MFRNFPTLISLLRRKGLGRFVLFTWDGLRITVRNNLFDARIVEEIFIEKPYIQRLVLPEKPLVVDVGAYIGDFSLYAAKYFGAEVLAYEPTRENFEMLQKNIELNGLSDQISAINKAVGNDKSLVLYASIVGEEVHVSAYRYFDAEKRIVTSDSLEEILKTLNGRKIDLLKLDCEGGEYDILERCPFSAFESIQNIVLEWHRIADYEKRLGHVMQRLKQADYHVTKKANILYALKKL